MKKNKNINIPVKFVDNLKETLGWISSTIHFWHLDKTYPMNLIDTVVTDFYEALKHDNLVSLSHINDK